MSGTLLPYTLNRPIGIFDSGVGGLTVLKALRRKLPHRDFVYLGDTARVPYGRKPAAMVAEFAYGITEFLRGMGVEGVVIACNTASASALPELAGHFSIPIWGVIEPGVEAAAKLTRTGRVGVIGTKGTIASGAYQRRLEQRGLTVWARACPMLVHIVEEGLATSPECDLLLRSPEARSGASGGRRPRRRRRRSVVGRWRRGRVPHPSRAEERRSRPRSGRCAPGT